MLGVPSNAATPIRPEPETQKLDARVLLAEDNVVNQAVAVAMLKSFGCRVDVAKNGLEAVSSVEREPFDLVLIDRHMPEMDGFAATRAIREAEQARGTERLPIIALTANAMEGDRDRCLAAGMDDYLSKPFKHSQLREVVEAWAVRGRSAA